MALIIVYLCAALLSLAGLTGLAVRAVMRFRPPESRPGPVSDRFVAGALSPLPFTVSLLFAESVATGLIRGGFRSGPDQVSVPVLGVPMSWQQAVTIAVGAAMSLSLAAIAVSGRPARREASTRSLRARLVTALLAPVPAGALAVAAAVLRPQGPCYGIGCEAAPWYSSTVLLFGIRRFSAIGWTLIALGVVAALLLLARAAAPRRVVV